MHSEIAVRKDAAKAVSQVTRDRDIVDLPGLLVMKMGVFMEIWAIASRLPNKIDLFDQTALDQGV
jgi:hypothetical protein